MLDYTAVIAFWSSRYWLLPTPFRKFLSLLPGTSKYLTVLYSSRYTYTTGQRGTRTAVFYLIPGILFRAVADKAHREYRVPLTSSAVT